jgi:hypothetical protein
VAEGARLESVCRFPYRGFESHPLRNLSNWPLPIFGAVAQLGERHVRNVQAEGSSPFCSTLAVLDGELAVP